jgi:hypothetical protein
MFLIKLSGTGIHPPPDATFIMSTSSIFAEDPSPPRRGVFRIFEVKNDVLIIENIVGGGIKSARTTINLDQVSLPSTPAKGRNVKMLKGAYPSSSCSLSRR